MEMKMEEMNTNKGKRKENLTKGETQRKSN